MRILAIETSCDDTGMALVDIKNRRKSKFPDIAVVENLIASQTKIHAQWGGVVPNLAKNEHIKHLPIIYRQLSTFHFPLPTDIIAVTVGPGLEPSLWAGIEFAKKLGDELKIPVVGANHLEGHLYSFLLPQKIVKSKKEKVERENLLSSIPQFPAIVLLVSGGNTILLHMGDLHHWQKLGETVDDAVGEAFDKVARMLELPYPGGPAIEKLAAQGNPNAIKFPRPMLHNRDYDFSFSGLKTSVLYFLKKADEADEAKKLTKLRADVAASFQQAAIEVLVKKTERAAQEFGAKTIVVCGGVAANTTLRTALKISAGKFGATFIAPDMEYNSDNAAMIAVAASMRVARRGRMLPLVANGKLGI